MRHCCFACMLEMELSSELRKEIPFSDQVRLLGRPYNVLQSSGMHACIVESLTSELILYIQCSSQHHGWRYEVLYMYDRCDTQNGRVVNPTIAIDSMDSLTV